MMGTLWKRDGEVAREQLLVEPLLINNGHVTSYGNMTRHVMESLWILDEHVLKT